MSRRRRLVGFLVVPLVLASCARNDLDRIFEDSLGIYDQVEREHYERVARWREGRDRSTLDPANTGSIPTYPERVYPPIVEERRMQFMEQRLLQSLDARCGPDDIECRRRALRRLGFECTGEMPVICTLENIARREGDNPIKNTRERHLWTVTITRGVASVSTQAKVAAANSGS